MKTPRSESSCATYESRRLRCANGMSARPLNETVPLTLSFLVRPETASSRVVLPLPEGPITASTWVGWRLDLSWGLELAG